MTAALPGPDDPDELELAASPAESPAESYARFRRTQASPQLAAFADAYGFAFDDYQVQACTYVEGGSGVLVAAPTGAGKTIVGEFAVFLARAQGRKCFYTTPIKALSNQKYADLVARYGPDQVGLLTGDSSTNGEAPIVVMTTEVLRNMMYANSPTLVNLGYVVMDEVHYLADRFRGAVWEEVIIGLAPSVQLVALSATVSNAEEFGEWLDEVRGGPDGQGVKIVVSERRPVPLFQHVLVGKRLYDLFADVAPTAAELPGGKAEVNPQLVQVARNETRHVRDDSRRPRSRSGRGKKTAGYGSGAYGGAAHSSRAMGPDKPRSLVSPSRFDLVEALDRAALLPAIVFIFSRVGCDAAVKQLLGSRLALTGRSDQLKIEEILARHSSRLSADDLRAVGYETFAEALRRGIAAHHAGMLPAFKEAVEEAFVRGLTKVVFATETLALGINMPARSVVLEKLVKYNGETHADITPGEYTQLTGRAGRRGIDIEGHAVVLWQPGLDPRAVAGLASRRTYPLRSSFAPTYNMAVNLVGHVGRERARTLLEQSFAQFQTDRSVVGHARTVARNTEAIADYWRAAACDRGDVVAYMELSDRISRAESEAAKARRADRKAEAVESLQALRPGDIVRVPSGRSAGWAVVIDPGLQGGGLPARPLVLTEDRQVRRLDETAFPTPVTAVGRIRVPKHFNGKERTDRRNLGAAFGAKLREVDLTVERHRGPRADGEVMAEVDRLRTEMRAHPCHSCPDREEHRRWAERALGLQRENERAEQRISKRTGTIAAHFDKICQVLESLDYLDGDQVTATGARLARIYAELDLVAAEAIRDGVFDDLTAPQLASVLSTLIYEARRSDTGPRHPRMPDHAAEQAVTTLRRVHRTIALTERDARLDRGPELDLGFAEAAYAWAAGQALDQVLHRSGLTAGDFVRWVRQVIDFAGQIADAAGPGPLRQTAREAVHRMRRGVVDVAAGGAEDDD